MKFVNKQFLMLAFAFTSLLAVGSAAHAGRYECQQAIQGLAAAQNYYNHMQVLLLNNAQFCPGGWQSNAACMMTIANGVNQATVGLQNAQAQKDYACSFRRPRHPHGGWGHGGFN